MKMAVADAAAHPRGLGPANHVDETEFRTPEESFEHIQHGRIPEEFREDRRALAQVGNLADGMSTILRRQNARVPLGIVFHMVPLQENLRLQAWPQALRVRRNLVHG